MAVQRPTEPEEVRQAVLDAAEAGRRLAITGGGSKSGFGAPIREGDILDLSGLDRILDYDPAELVLTVQAGARLADVETLLRAEGQMLAFEPYDHGPLYGRPAGASTMGGIIAAGVGGSRRLSRGGARDHLLGLKAVSGRGDAFVAGARVVKNVTGFDLPKLVCGSWGRLLAVTELTVKVLPAGRERMTLLAEGLEISQAQWLMSRAMSSSADVAAAAHRPAASALAITALRLEGVGAAMSARAMLVQAAAGDVQLRPADGEEAEAFWREMRDLSGLGVEQPLWRMVIPEGRAAAALANLEAYDLAWRLDWAGGLIWLATDAPVATVRVVAEAAGGHANLVRADEALRTSVPALHPASAGVRALEARLRSAFDPSGVFDTGRFPEVSHAN